jgi:zinc/manganese transport system substrate-binding protein
MKYLTALLTLLLLFSLPAKAEAELNVVATLPALAQIAKAVCGDDGHVRTLARAGQDPHFVPPKPTLARHLARADLLFSVGLALESGWLPPLIQLSRNDAIRSGGHGYFAGSDYIDVIGADRVVDRSMGDVHPEGNPHWWLDPLRVAEVAIALAERMAQLDPGNGEAYRARANVFAGRIKAEIDAWRRQLAQAKPVVTYHDSYRYFTERFGIRIAGFVEPKPGIEPSTAHLDRLVARLQQGAATALWLEPYHDTSTARRVCERGGIPCLVMPDVVEGEGGEGYIALIDLLVKRSQQ